MGRPAQSVAWRDDPLSPIGELFFVRWLAPV